MKSYTASTLISPVKLAVSALFSILLINSSCSDPASVGLELAPGNNQIGVFYQEFELEADVILLDSFNTTNTTILLAGHETDDFFGTTEVTGFSRMYLNPTSTRPKLDAILDSTLFSLDFVSVNGSDLDQAKQYSIYQLAEGIQDTTYYNFNQLAYLETPIAQTEIVFEDVKDTTLVFPMEEAFAEAFFSKLRDPSQFQNLFQFRDYFPGIAVKARAGDNTAVGIAKGENTKMTYYYHYDGDTVASSFSIFTSNSRSFNGVQSDRSGTPTQIVTERGETYDVGSVVGMKSSLGMALRVDTSPIDAFLDTLSGVIFNQVNFKVGEIVDQDEGNTPISSLVMKFVDSNNRVIKSTLTAKTDLHVITDGQAQVVEDENGDLVPSNYFAAAATLTYDSEAKEYSTRITSHVNAIFRGDLQTQNWLLYADNTGSGSSGGLYPYYADFARSMRQFKTDKNKIRVQVIYSKMR